MTQFVLITGYMGCGKSTVSNILRDKSFYVLDMDSTIKFLYYKDLGTKDILCQIFGHNAFKPYDENLKTCPPNMEYLRQEMFKSEKCTICNNILKGVKYICCLCDNYILCEECELYHIHPCFKYKMHFISNVIETSNFIEKCYGFKFGFWNE